MPVTEAQAESLVIHECNRAQILLINAVATKFSGIYTTSKCQGSPAPIIEMCTALYSQKSWI